MQVRPRWGVAGRRHAPAGTARRRDAIRRRSLDRREGRLPAPDSMDSVHGRRDEHREQDKSKRCGDGQLRDDLVIHGFTYISAGSGMVGMGCGTR